MGEAISTTGREGGKNIWSKIWERKDHNKKAKWIYMETDLRIFEEDLQVNIHTDGLKATLKKIANWKAPGINSIRGFWF